MEKEEQIRCAPWLGSEEGKKGRKRKRQKKRKDEEGGGAKAHLSPVLERPRGKGAPGRAPNAESGVVLPGRGASAEARGISAASESRCAGGHSPPPPPGSSGIPSWGPGVEENAACGRPQPWLSPEPAFSAQQAGSTGEQAPRLKLGHRDGDLDAVHPLWRFLGSGESPNPAAPAPPPQSNPSHRHKGK